MRVHTLALEPWPELPDPWAALRVVALNPRRVRRALGLPRRVRLGQYAQAVGVAASAAGSFLPHATGAAGEAQTALSYTGTAVSVASIALSAGVSTGLIAAAPIIAGVAIIPVLGWIAAAIAVVVVVLSLLGGASKRWQTFPKRLKRTLDNEGAAVQWLAQHLHDAHSYDELAAAIRSFKWQITMGGVGGFAQQGGPWDVPTPPGATGTAHEGGITADFEPIMAKIRELLQIKINEIGLRVNAERTVDWLKHIYRALLGRDPTSDEAFAAVNALLENKTTGAAVIDAIKATPEYQARLAQTPSAPGPSATTPYFASPAAVTAAAPAIPAVPVITAPAAAGPSPLLPRTAAGVDWITWMALALGAGVLWEVLS